jgi:hypothetical protein
MGLNRPLRNSIRATAKPDGPSAASTRLAVFRPISLRRVSLRLTHQARPRLRSEFLSGLLRGSPSEGGALVSPPFRSAPRAEVAKESACTPSGTLRTPSKVRRRSDPGVQTVGLKRGRPVCLQADPRETPCGRVVAGVARSRICGESARAGSQRSSSRPTAARLSGALCSVSHAAEIGGAARHGPCLKPRSSARQQRQAS